MNDSPNPASNLPTNQGRFRLLVIDSVPYALLDQLAPLDLIRPEVRRSLAQASLEELDADAALVRVSGDEETQAHLQRLRAGNPHLPLIGIACHVDDEPAALDMLDAVLDDYLLDQDLNAERIVRALRQARRQRATIVQLRAQTLANERLRRRATDRRLGLELIGQLLETQTDGGEFERQSAIRWLDELRESRAPRRSRCSIADIVRLANCATAADLEVAGNDQLQVYADVNQLADVVAEIANACGCGRLRIAADTTTDSTVEVRLRISLDERKLCRELTDNVMSRYPSRSLFQTRPHAAANAARLSNAKRLVEHNLGDWTFSEAETQDAANTTIIELTLPTREASDVFARYCELRLKSLGPDCQITLLQVCLPDSEPASKGELHALLKPEELAFPTSASRWLIALADEPDEIDRRITQLSKDWNSVTAGREATQPLVARLLGRWSLPGRRDELLAIVQTMCELGDLSLETHPKLLLVRTDTSTPTPLGRQLKNAGYQVITSPESEVNQMMSTHQPDAVVFACGQPAGSFSQRSVAQSMESVASIPVILMTATARHIQQGLRRDVQSLGPLSGEAPDTRSQPVEASEEAVAETACR